MAIGKKTGGRVKGTPNKATKAVKDALVEAFEELGGVTSLVAWASAEPTEFYKLWSKLLPQEVKASGSLGITLERLITGDAIKSDE